jgi:hypothetical protein
MKNAVMWDVTPRGSLRIDFSGEHIVSIISDSMILSVLMMEVIRSSETSVLTKVTRHYIPENGVFIVTSLKSSNLK